MIFVYGGAYQGKLDFALAHGSLPEDQVFHCKEDGELDLSQRVINGLEKHLLFLVRSGISPTLWLGTQLQELSGKIVILQDISCGVVPLEKDIRLWREEVGRVAVQLSKNSREVYRLYCGIPTKLK